MLNLTHEQLAEAGIFQYGYIDPADIEFREEIQDICRGNACRAYSKTWACPPAIGGIEECRERCNRYKNALVFSCKYDLEDSYDYEGMVEAGEEFRQTCDKLWKMLEGYKNGNLLLANGGCQRCPECTYPDFPCRFPEKLFPAFEGHGIVVAEVAKMAGINYINGKDTVTYLGMLLYNA